MAKMLALHSDALDPISEIDQLFNSVEISADRE